MCTPHSGRAHWPLTTCEGGKEGVRREGQRTHDHRKRQIKRLGAEGGTTPSMRSQPHWLREKEGTRIGIRAGWACGSPTWWNQSAVTQSRALVEGKWLSPPLLCGPALSHPHVPQGTPGHRAPRWWTCSPTFRSRSPAPVVQGRHTWNPHHPSAPQPPVPLRGRALPACTLGLPPHLWSGLSVLFGSWKEEKEEGKHFGFYKVKEFIS